MHNIALYTNEEYMLNEHVLHEFCIYPEPGC